MDTLTLILPTHENDIFPSICVSFDFFYQYIIIFSVIFTSLPEFIPKNFIGFVVVIKEIVSFLNFILAVLRFAREVLCHLRHIPDLFCFSYFSARLSNFLLGIGHEL
jgi:hypothetical protein